MEAVVDEQLYCFHSNWTHSGNSPQCQHQSRGSSFPHPRAAGVPTTAGHPLLPFPLQLMALHCNLQQGGIKWGVAFCTVWITLHGVLWGAISPGPLLSGSQVWLQLHYFIPSDHWNLQQGQRRAEGANSFPTTLISCTKLQQTLCLPCSFSAHLSVVKANAKCCWGSREPSE